jgi:hypothetical protein
VHHKSLSAQGAVDEAVHIIKDSFAAFQSLEAQIITLRREQDIAQEVSAFLKGCVNLCMGALRWTSVSPKLISLSESTYPYDNLYMTHLDSHVLTDMIDTTSSATSIIHRAWVLPKFLWSWAALTQPLEVMGMPTKLTNSIEADESRKPHSFRRWIATSPNCLFTFTCLGCILLDRNLDVCDRPVS